MTTSPILTYGFGSYGTVHKVPTLGFLSSTGTGHIKVPSGSSFVAKPVKVWNGSSWVVKPLKYWNGSAWTITPY